MSEHAHVPIVAGSWGDGVDLGDGTQRITNSGPCRECRQTVYRVEVRSAPADAEEWPVGEDLLSAGPWGTAGDHARWLEAIDRMYAAHVADVAAWQRVCARLDESDTDGEVDS